MKLLQHAVAALLIAMSASAAAEPTSLQTYLAIKGVMPGATFAYGNAPSQRAEFFAPDGDGPFPVVILLHGGCWRSRYGGLAQFRVLADAFARQGITAWNIDTGAPMKRAADFPAPVPT